MPADDAPAPDARSGSPAEEYGARLARWAAEDARLGGRADRLAGVRLGTFLVGGALALWIMVERPTWWPALVVPVAVFAVAVVLHHRAAVEARRARALHGHYARGVDRLEERWPGTGPDGAALLADEDRFGHDLDLFGTGSLFQRLATCATSLGHDRLADQLTRPATRDEILARQAAVAELAPDLALREELAVLAASPDDAGASSVGRDAPPVARARAASSPLPVRPDALAAWGADTTETPRAGLVRGTSWVLGGLGVVAAVGWATSTLPVWTLSLVVLLDLGFGRLVGGLLGRQGADVVRAGAGLEWLAGLLRHLEDGGHEAPALRELRARLESEGALPSQRVGELVRLVDGLEASRRNAFYALFAFLTQAPVRTALALDDWRRAHGPRVAEWLDVAGRFEALVALATYAYERPQDVVPEVVEGAPRFRATGLGHPLIPDERCVRNDLRLDDGLRLVLLSGSNMSGKSTLLRAVGLNLCLARAGAPVKATSLELTPLALAASIRIEDNLREGTSHFYAEIKRLRLIDEMIDGDVPVLYLLDEVLHGTNSDDRLAGTDAVIRKFVARGALGMVTTHDLALAAIADELGEVARNVHLEDSLVDGEMTFDYTLRDGVVTRGNALPLMRSLGLDV